MIVYAESSAILAWLLGEHAGASVRQHLAVATTVATSRITVGECHRALVRAVSGGLFAEGTAAGLRATLARAATHWLLMEVTDAVVARVGSPFPAEPVRTLDALHLASALIIRSASPDLSVLSLDRRVRRNAVSLGFEVLPAPRVNPRRPG